ncbi:MAG: D-alanine--D-alanine ligase [Clostridia bacterium]|nr:D-alanine--D-alanine ligase [Clostridia bacterium]
MEKKSVAVLFGGVSSEHDVSLASAENVISSIPTDKYDVYKIGITKDGRWFKYDGPTELKGSKWESHESCVPACILPDRGRRGITIFEGDEVKTIDIDCVFPVLHGKNGEDGTMQGLMELAGIPCVGCDMISSAMSMDKAITNTIMDYAGIPQAKWLAVTKYDYAKSAEEFISRAIDYLCLPIFVKPACAGSSVGVSKANDVEALIKAIELAFKHDNKVVLEQTIVGREIECAVLGNDELQVATPCEIIPGSEFYDYESKYIDDTTKIELVAQLNAEQVARLKALAMKTYKALGCCGMARVDFFVSNDGENMYLNEINTIPGFTPISMYPKMFENAGKSYSQLVSELIELAIEKSR